MLDLRPPRQPYFFTNSSISAVQSRCTVCLVLPGAYFNKQTQHTAVREAEVCKILFPTYASRLPAEGSRSASRNLCKAELGKEGKGKRIVVIKHLVIPRQTLGG